MTKKVANMIVEPYYNQFVVLVDEKLVNTVIETVKTLEAEYKKLNKNDIPKQQVLHHNGGEVEFVSETMSNLDYIEHGLKEMFNKHIEIAYDINTIFGDCHIYHDPDKHYVEIDYLS